MCTVSYSSRSRRAFTLVELMVVVVIMGVLSAAVVPAMSNVRAMREGGARDDVVRMIQVAKGRAVASGMPRGLRVNLSDSSLTIVKITDLGDVEIGFDPLTNGDRTINIASLYSGVSIVDMVNGNGAGGSGIIWFDYESSPHTRNASGGFVALNTTNVTITLSSGEQVIVYPFSGTLEVQ